MLFSRDWLADYVALPEAVGELAERLTQAGFNVEGQEQRGGDILLDVDVTTNRPDCMNHLGLAREIAVLFDRPFNPPSAALAEGEGETAQVAEVVVEDPAGCLRYVARAVRGVKVGPSPEWLADRLRAIGLRPLNNVVDITNYVLWEQGQPLHAFDLNRLRGGKIVVRRAREGERLRTLDGEVRELHPEILVIADGEGPVALAGVMGGEETEVTAATSDVLLESAHFDPKVVRRGARRLGLHTDAAHRFERGADPEACLRAADRAAALLAELAGGEVLSGSRDVRSDGRPGWPPRGRLELARLNAFAGCEIPAADVERWLSGLGFGMERAGEGSWEVTVPSWRYYDLEPAGPSGEVYEADLFEEVLRIYGFGPIPSALPPLAGPDPGRSEAHERRQQIRQRLAASGYLEAINYAFYDPESARAYAALGEGGAAELENPLSERYSVLRRSLLPGLVESARFNSRRGADGVRLFEVGHLFFAQEDGGIAEVEAVALVAGGTYGRPWDRPVELDLFALKGVVDALAADFGVGLASRPARLRGFVPGTAGELLTGGPQGEVVGHFGRLASGDEGFPLFGAELTAEVLSPSRGPRPAELPSRYPGVEADLTVTHPLEVSWSELAEAIARQRIPDLAAFGLKDRYLGAGVPPGAVNTTIHFLYNAQDRSLTQEEVNERHLALAEELERRFGWKG